MTRARAKDSPLRDYMLGLHKRGISVKFFDGRPENPEDRSQMFFVEMPAGYSIEEHIEIIRNINEALKKSAALSPVKNGAKLNRRIAMDYVKRLAAFKEQSGHNK